MANRGAEINKAFHARSKKEEPLVALFDDLPAIDCLKILNDANILSAPVFEDAPTKRKFHGILDLLDLCAYAITVYDEVQDKEKLDTWQMIFENGLRRKNARELLNYSKANYCRPVESTASFKEILDNLSSKTVHRLPIFKFNAFDRLLTQSEVLRFISQHMELFGYSIDQSVIASGLIGKAYYVNAKQPVIDAFRMLIEKKVASVGVLDDQQKVIGSVSVRNLREVIRDRPNLKLKEPISKFLTEINGGTIAGPMVISADTAVRVAITKMTTDPNHQLYVVDSNRFPQGAVSSSDLFTFLLRIGFDHAPSPAPGHKIDIKTVEEAQEKLYVPALHPPKGHHPNILDQSYHIIFPNFKSEDQLVSVLNKSSAETVVKTLREKKISCVPVLDLHRKTDNHPRVQGLVDVSDVATYVFGLKKDPAFAKDTTVTFDSLYLPKLAGVYAKELINCSGRNHAALLGQQTRLLDVFAALSIPGVHRVPIVTFPADSKHGHSHGKAADGKHEQLSSEELPSTQAVGKFITQTDVLRFVATHLEAFGTVLDKTIVAARVGVFKPKSINVKSTAVEGFHYLIKSKVSGAAVVDDHFKVLGSLSTTDLRLVVVSNPMLNVNKPISEFWNDIKADETYSKPLRLITCSYTDTVHHVITKMNSNQVHRLFIVDEHGLLLGVVSVSAILKYILRVGNNF